MSVQENMQEVITQPPADCNAEHLTQIPLNSIKTIIGQLKNVMGQVTLEPMLFVKMVAEGNVVVIIDTLQLDRVCRVNLNYSEEDCIAMDDGNHSHIQETVQVYQNTFNFYQGFLASILPVLIVLFAGSISDQYGRKLPMIASLCGYVAFAFIYIITILNPSWPVEVLYASSIAINLGGTWVVFNMAVYSYLADITPIRTRAKRMGLLDAFWYMGGPIGTVMGVWLYQVYGYIAVFAMSAILWSSCVVYTLAVVKESVVQQTTTQKEKPFKFVLDLGRAAFKRYPNRGRLHLFLLMGIKLGIYLVQGHQVYLWARRVLGWNVTQYSNWSGANDALRQVGMVVLLGLASSYKLSDYTIAIFGLISIALWNIMSICITGPSLWWMVIIATLVGAFKCSIEPALRALITSIPDKRDVGKILGFLGLLESVWFSIDRTIFTYLYNSSIETFPQMNYVVGSAFALILILALILLKRDWENEGNQLTYKKGIPNRKIGNEIKRTAIHTLYSDFEDVIGIFF